MLLFARYSGKFFNEQSLEQGVPKHMPIALKRLLAIASAVECPTFARSSAFGGFSSLSQVWGAVILIFWHRGAQSPSRSGIDTVATQVWAVGDHVWNDEAIPMA